MPWWSERPAAGRSRWRGRRSRAPAVHFSGTRHPQTQGKVERFHGAWGTGRTTKEPGEIYLNDRLQGRPGVASETAQLQRVEPRILVYFCATLVREIDLGMERSTAVDLSMLNPTCKRSPDNDV